jgi:hypothetical protein
MSKVTMPLLVDGLDAATGHDRLPADPKDVALQSAFPETLLLAKISSAAGKPRITPYDAFATTNVAANRNFPERYVFDTRSSATLQVLALTFFVQTTQPLPCEMHSCLF